MGNKQSSNQYVQNNMTFQQTSETFIKQTTNIGASASTVSNIEVEIECENDIIFEGDFISLNAVLQNVTVVNTMNLDLSQEQVADIQGGVQNDADSVMDKVNEDFGALLSAAQSGSEANKTIKNDISTVIRNTLTKETITNIIANSSTVVGTKIVIRSKNLTLKKDFKVDNNVVSNLTASNIVQEVISEVMKTKSVQDLENKLRDLQTQKNTGVATIVTNVGNAIKGIISSSQIIFIVIGVVIVVGILFGSKYIKSRNAKRGNMPPNAQNKRYPSYPPMGQQQKMMQKQQQRRLPPQSGQQNAQQYRPAQNARQYQPQQQYQQNAAPQQYQQNAPQQYQQNAQNTFQNAYQNARQSLNQQFNQSQMGQMSPMSPMSQMSQMSPVIAEQSSNMPMQQQPPQPMMQQPPSQQQFDQSQYQMSPPPMGGPQFSYDQQQPQQLQQGFQQSIQSQQPQSFI